MTDTTDIKALKPEPLCFLVQQESRNGPDCYVECHDGYRNSQAVYSAEQMQELLDQFEAERQRADRYHFVAMSALETQAEISEQLGINEDECDGSPEQVHEKIEMLQKEISALKAKLANPVVLPERWKPCDCIDCAYAYDSEATKKAINEAGFTVKGDL